MSDEKPRIQLLPLAGDTEIRESKCPACGELISAAGSLDHQDLPTPGDPTVCMYCGYLAVFAEDFALRAPAPAEIVAFKRQRGLWREIRRLQKLFRENDARAFDLRPQSKPN